MSATTDRGIAFADLARLDPQLGLLLDAACKYRQRCRPGPQAVEDFEQRARQLAGPKRTGWHAVLSRPRALSEVLVCIRGMLLH